MKLDKKQCELANDLLNHPGWQLFLNWSTMYSKAIDSQIDDELSGVAEVLMREQKIGARKFLKLQPVDFGNFVKTETDRNAHE